MKEFVIEVGDLRTSQWPAFLYATTYCHYFGEMKVGDVWLVVALPSFETLADGQVSRRWLVLSSEVVGYVYEQRHGSGKIWSNSAWSTTTKHAGT